PGVENATDVQTAIKKMSTLEPPKQGEVPGIGFAPTNNWLFGTDLGVLRIGDGASGRALVRADQAGGDAGNYVVTLQIVFDDPLLYGLRLALEGDAAKVFAGLDFQIMYR